MDPSRIAFARRPARLLAAAGALSILAVGLGACGGLRNSAEAKKLRTALQKCGVTLPNRGQNGPPQQQQGATPSGTTAS